MIVGILLAAALAGAHPSDPSPYFLDTSTVVQASCDDGWGTAFYIGDGKFITARHVALNTDKKGWPNAHCHIGGKPVRILQVGHGAVDYALVSAPFYPPYRAIVSCKPIVEGEVYFATGYAGGNEWPVTQRLVGTTSIERDSGAGEKENLFRGSTTEGQSGGPVSDNDGLVRGIVSAGADAGETTQMILEMADTPYCQAKKDQ